MVIKVRIASKTVPKFFTNIHDDSFLRLRRVSGTGPCGPWKQNKQIHISTCLSVNLHPVPTAVGTGQPLKFNLFLLTVKEVELGDLVSGIAFHFYPLVVF